ncbi:MAG: ATP-binding protein [Sandaracinaceae bacterium]|nr:ATP-binding protein [Sandaracinaceae bacterium]
MTERDNLIRDGLERPPQAIGYALNEHIVRAFPGKYVMRTTDLSFDLDTWVERTSASVITRDVPLPEWDTRWSGPGQGVFRRLAQGHRSVALEGVTYDVVEVAWERGFSTLTTQWWIGPDRERVEGFAAHVAEVANEVVDEVLVFANGCWQRSPKLRAAIRKTTFDSLVLPEGMADHIREDFASFLGARAEYERYGVPWKRGALFLGPPGNGKTHCVKALLNALDVPCLYVQSFESPHGGNAQPNVAEAFARARRTTPCALVLEDLDALVTPATRSYFLNELDGFADNAGILAIATTNHPERLDPAILDRPSRFDRKYSFELPGSAERLAYLTHWRDRLEGDTALGQETLDQVAETTEGFSYAYLKELVFSSLVGWMSHGRARPLDDVIVEQVGELTRQMASAAAAHEEARPVYVGDRMQEDYAHLFRRRG